MILKLINHLREQETETITVMWIACVILKLSNTSFRNLKLVTHKIKTPIVTRFGCFKIDRLIYWYKIEHVILYRCSIHF